MTKLTKAVGEPKEVATFAAKSPDDEEIGTTLPTHCSSDVAESDTMNAVTTKDNKTSYGDFTASAGTDNTIRNSVGKDLVWSDVNMRLLDKKTGNVKLDILKVSGQTGRMRSNNCSQVPYIIYPVSLADTFFFHRTHGEEPKLARLPLLWEPRVREVRSIEISLFCIG